MISDRQVLIAASEAFEQLSPDKLDRVVTFIGTPQIGRRCVNVRNPGKRKGHTTSVRR